MGRPKKRNATLELLQAGGGNLLAIERSVQPAPPRFADKTIDAAKRAMRGVIEYMVAKDILLRQVAVEVEQGAHVEDEELDRLCREKELELKEHRLGTLKDDTGFWALLFHRNAVAGSGKVSIEHMNCLCMCLTLSTHTARACTSPVSWPLAAFVRPSRTSCKSLKKHHLLLQCTHRRKK